MRPAPTPCLVAAPVKIGTPLAVAVVALLGPVDGVPVDDAATVAKVYMAPAGAEEAAGTVAPVAVTVAGPGARTTPAADELPVGVTKTTWGTVTAVLMMLVVELPATVTPAELVHAAVIVVTTETTVDGPAGETAGEVATTPAVLAETAGEGAAVIMAGLPGT